MRDPFERIWSEVRMNIKNKYPDQKNNEEFVCVKLLETYRLKGVEEKTRYERMIKNLENVFDNQNIHYEFSENLYSQQGLDRITNHLGMLSVIVDVNSPNPSPKMTVVPNEVKQEIVNFYKDTYISIFDKFGDDAKVLWNESFKLL